MRHIGQKLHTRDHRLHFVTFLTKRVILKHLLCFCYVCLDYLILRLCQLSLFPVKSDFFFSFLTELLLIGWGKHILFDRLLTWIGNCLAISRFQAVVYPMLLQNIGAWICLSSNIQMDKHSLTVELQIPVTFRHVRAPQVKNDVVTPRPRFCSLHHPNLLPQAHPLLLHIFGAHLWPHQEVTYWFSLKDSLTVGFAHNTGLFFSIWSKNSQNVLLPGGENVNISGFCIICPSIHTLNEAPQSQGAFLIHLYVVSFPLGTFQTQSSLKAKGEKSKIHLSIIFQTVSSSPFEVEIVSP